MLYNEFQKFYQNSSQIRLIFLTVLKYKILHPNFLELEPNSPYHGRDIFNRFQNMNKIVVFCC